ncbi:glycosyltransferase family 2 protein [Desulfovibrio inopinatus]|uniref:glycosyltransferase family 2 protein n=1 Tax=Desulfovibrio inopinatus TaxID=102109 RepID=UPI0003FA338B|nr:glycosyltransferase family 2 protein [Desulfovibrio inopinatus]
MDVAIVIISYNTCELLSSCLEAVFAHPPHSDFTVVIVDNASSDGSTEMIQQRFPHVVLLKNTMNMGFAAACNQAFSAVDCQFYFLLNPDARVMPGSFDACLRLLETEPSCAMVGGRIENPSGTLEPSARAFPTPFTFFLTLSGLAARFPRTLGKHDRLGMAHDAAQRVDWVPGTFACIRSQALERVGTFDERFFLYYEETDLCRRMNYVGLEVWFLPEATVVHEGGASSKTQTDKVFDTGGSQVLSFRLRSQYLYFRKHHGIFGVLAVAAIEIGWHGLRMLVNCRPGPLCRSKRQYSRTIIQCAVAAFRDTKRGTYSPQRPW